MREKETASRTVPLILLAVLAVCIFCICTVGRQYPETARQENEAYLAGLLEDDTWSVLRPDGSLTPVSLPARILPESGNTVTILSVLPRYLNTGACLAFQTSGAEVTVQIDREEIYQSRQHGSISGIRSWHMISLDNSQAEGIITIALTAQDAAEAGMLPRILLGPETEILLLAGTENSLNRNISTAIMVLGLLLLFFAAMTAGSSSFAGDCAFQGISLLALGIAALFSFTDPMQSLKGGYIRQSFSACLYLLFPAWLCFSAGSKDPYGEDRRTGRMVFVYLCLCIFIMLCRWLPKGPLPFSLLVLSGLGQAAVYVIILVCGLRVKTESFRSRLFRSVSLLLLLYGTLAVNLFFPGRIFRIGPLILASFGFALFRTAAVVISAYDYLKAQMQLNEELAESRQKLMVNQMRPHFLRSALGAIRMVIKRDPEKAYGLIYDFTNYLTFSMDHMDSLEPVDFTEELQHIREYTAIEEERFRPRIKVEYDIGPEKFKVPHLSVQPLVENAIVHGALCRREGGTVRLSTEETPDAYLIIIRDNGPGFDPANPPPARPGHGLSMKNAAYRLKSMVGGKISISSSDEGTVVTVSIPRTGREEI